jgi:SPP1 family phage portal protein
MPVVEYPNNNLKISDCDKVLELIDAYDRIISDTSNELEQMRLAYLTISGGQRLTKEEAREFKTQLQDAGVLHLPDGVTANFLLKTVDMSSVLSFLTVIENNIYKFSKSINYANSKFTGGQLTGIALKQATVNLRNKCLNSWLSFDDANWYQWNILGEFIQSKKAMQTPPDFKIEGYIKLNIPTDNKEIANTMQTFKGSLSTKTILRLAELNLDIDQEYEEMVREGLVQENKENPKTGFVNE